MVRSGCSSLSPLSRWVWAEGGTNPDLEQKLDVGGFGYPVWNLTSCVTMSLPSSSLPLIIPCHHLLSLLFFLLLLFFFFPSSCSPSPFLSLPIPFSSSFRNIPECVFPNCLILSSSLPPSLPPFFPFLGNGDCELTQESLLITPRCLQS